MTNYPSSLPTLSNPTESTEMDVLNHDELHTDENNEITAIATELGTNPKTITDATAPGASPTSVAQFLDMVATHLKAIVGGANWYTGVTKSLADLVTHLASTANPHSTSDANLVTTDVTTNDVSTSKHGFTPKAPNDSTKFLRGDASWAVPSSSLATDTIWDAKGDLVAGTGADASSKLTVGSNGQILVADSAVSNGLKWSTLIGCKVYLSADMTDVGTGVVKVLFNTEAYDTGTAFNTGTSTFTVPAGKAGYYMLYEMIYFYSSVVDGNQHHVLIYRNGASIADATSSASSTAGISTQATVVVHLDATDTVEFYVQSSSASADLYSPQSHSYGLVQQLTQD